MVEIGTANISHLDAIVALLSDDKLGATREDASRTDAYITAFEEIQADPNARILVALNGEKVVGCLQLNILANLTLTGSKRGLIEGVRVDKTMRGKGVGRRLFDAAIAICHDADCAMVQLTTNNVRPDAAAFYENLGFVGSHIGFKLLLEPKTSL